MPDNLPRSTASSPPTMEDVVRQLAEAMSFLAHQQGRPAGGESINPLRLAPPVTFDGRDAPDKRERATTFIHQCELHFETAEQVYMSDRSRIIFASTHLSGQAALWSRSYTLPAAAHCTWETFKTLFLTAFGMASREYLVESELLDLRQGQGSVGEYTARFNSLVGLIPEWNNAALRGVFRHGLRPDIELSIRAHNDYSGMSLLDIQNLAAQYDRPAPPVEHPRRDTPRTHAPPPPVAPPPQESSFVPPSAPPQDLAEPMDLSGTRGDKLVTCFRCYQTGHYANQCSLPKVSIDKAPAWIQAAAKRHYTRPMQLAAATLGSAVQPVMWDEPEGDYGVWTPTD
jgi:hypothetical protein